MAGDINDALEKHLRDWMHFREEEMGGRTVAEVVADHKRYDTEIEELATALLGSRRTDLEGGGRNDEEGLVDFLRNGHAHKLQRRQVGALTVVFAAIVYAGDIIDLLEGLR